MHSEQVPTASVESRRAVRVSNVLAKTLRRWLYLIHRWFGIGMCLLIALWFASGIIMMYVEYPELTEAERLDMLPPLPLAAVHVDATAAAALLGAQDQEFADLRLSTVLGRPAWQFRAASGRLSTVFADDGTLLQGISAADAEAAALGSGFASGTSTATDLGAIEMDQWTVSSGLTPYRPLHKVALNDAAGTVLYVSASNGQIVRDTSRNERFWNWLGSTIHWIYPWQLRRNVDLWVEVIIWLSLAGMVSVISGGIVGWWRLRIRKPFRGQSVTPYRGWYKWHHILGLGSLLFLATFMFSGLMSMAPWGIFANASSPAPAFARYTGGVVRDLPAYPGFSPGPATALLAAGLKEVEWTRLNGEPYLILVYSSTTKQVVGTDSAWAPAELRARVNAAIPALLPGTPVLGSEMLTRYDNYYYSHHNRYRPLPVLRVRFDDAEQSWFHLDLGTGQVLDRLTHTDRVARWLYNGLHSLDFALLFQNRPVWDVVVILLSLIGLAFSVTSVWVGWRRLRH